MGAHEEVAAFSWVPLDRLATLTEGLIYADAGRPRWSVLHRPARYEQEAPPLQVAIPDTARRPWAGFGPRDRATLAGLGRSGSAISPARMAGVHASVTGLPGKARRGSQKG